MDLSLLFLFFLIHAVLFVTAYRIGSKAHVGSSSLQKLGRKLLNTKEKQLAKSPLLKRFSRAVDENSIVLAQIIIALLIFIKSIGMTLIGFIGLSLLIVPVQGLMMAALIGEMKTRSENTIDLNRTMSLQLAAMLMLTSLGNALGWAKWFQNQDLNTVVGANLVLIVSVLLLSLITSFLTAREEVKFFKANRTLLG